MTAGTKWSIGCDPGFKETGLVLVKHVGSKRHVQAWATMACKPNGSHYKRTEALSFAVIQWVEKWYRKYKIKAMDFAIETPFFSGNPKTFALQWRLIQEIEGIVASMYSSDQSLWITEVGNKTSKALATGDGGATKSDMVEAAPECMYYEEMDPHTAETLADAWAHSLAAWRGCKDCTRLRIDVELAKVQQVCEGVVE